MSLISEALKKAQAQQQGQPTPSAIQTPPPAIEPTTVVPAVPAAVPLPAPTAEDRRSSSKPLVFFAIAAIALVFMLGGGLIVWGVLNITGPRQDAVAIVAPSESQAPAMTNPTPSTAPAPGASTHTPAVAKPAIAANSTASQTSSSAPSESLQSPPSAPESALAPITFKVEENATQAPPQQPSAPIVVNAPKPAPQRTSAPTSKPITAVAPPPVQLPAIRGRIAGFEIRGIMRGGGKVLLYDPESQRSRAFSTSDLVDANLGISISSISSNELVFLDQQGAKYLKRF
jgi:hypothetical protein|tara:strand:+ start:384 stop:1244 length:861 start_codon:yes stop_codon:yes gene_type:complete